MRQKPGVAPAPFEVLFSGAPMRRAALSLSLAGALGGALVSSGLHAAGPGLANQSYPAAEVFQIIGRIDGALGAPRAHGTLVMHNGYLAVIFSKDSGEGDGGFAFYDVSDPRNPKLVFAKDDAETEDIREAHGFGVSRIGGRDYIVLQASFGVQFWDWTDVTQPKLVKYLKLPGITDSDYGTGAWWTFWQGTHVYVGGSGNGLYIVDAANPAKAKLSEVPAGSDNPVPIGRLGAFKTGPVFALGNQLAITAMDQQGFAMVDITDPVRPQLLVARKDDVDKVYAGIWNGDLLLGAGTAGRVVAVDVSKPGQIPDAGRSEQFNGRGAYITVQDGFAHIGGSKRYFKVDLKQKPMFPIVGSASSELSGRDEDFANVFGNLVFISDDHGKGTHITPHQAKPDTTPPVVNRAEPPAGSLGVAVTSRVGLSFTDQLDFSSITEQNFVVREVGGAPVDGIMSYQSNFLSFAPTSPWKPNQSYEVRLEKGGARDAAGNPLAETFLSQFSTGNAIDNPLCEVDSLGASEVGAAVNFDVSTPAGGDLSFSWVFGDGSAPQAGKQATHAFDSPGHYTVVVRIEKDGSLLTACAAPFTAHRPLTSSLPTKSSGLFVDEAKQVAWVANPDSSSVSRVDLSTGTLDREFPVGAEPRAVALGADGRTWVVSERSSTLSILDAGGNTETVNLGRGTRPAGLAFAPDGSAAYVTLYATGQLAELDPVTGALRRKLSLGAQPRGLSVSADGATVWVTRFISPAEHAEIYLVNAMDFAVERTSELAMDLGPDTEASGRGVLNYLRSPAISPDGTRAFVPAKKDNTGRGFWQDGNNLTFESTVRAVVAQVKSDGSEDLSLRRDLNDRNLPSDVAISPLGDLAFVATEGTNTIEVLDSYDASHITSIEKVGKAPDAVRLSKDGKTLYVHSFISRSLHVYDVSAIVLAGSNQAARLFETRTVESEPLALDVLVGKQIFYDSFDRRMSRDKYLSCASCHLNGEQDGRVWDFMDRGEGLRNTITLLGKAGTSQGYLHWSANFDEVHDFENDIRNAFGGTGLLTDADFELTSETLGTPKAGRSTDLDALSAYVSSLDRVYDSPHRAADGRLSDAARGGHRHFESLGCGRCHSGADLTNSAAANLENVGTQGAQSGMRLGETLEGLDTPTLKGMWTTAPFLHDGSAETLDDVLDAAVAAGTAHGNVARLSESEQRELVAYLSSLDEEPIREEYSARGGCSLSAGGNPASPPGLGGLLLLLLAARRRRLLAKDSLDPKLRG